MLLKMGKTLLLSKVFHFSQKDMLKRIRRYIKIKETRRYVEKERRKMKMKKRRRKNRDKVRQIYVKGNKVVFSFYFC